ncbi:MAG TPA: sigma-54 dependent transcriptional regulator [Spirochaetota bacterium]|nr:sigma-54 dependent transcriptional regulator [Spirochaetota bacterium]HOL57084.1 sigma-54 dependent transcriptional regulator [Spirochaetota bacterium]HPP04693.1 sigma-54 dependent transcriptional regulator [Spirochaetota bacterium]
MKILLVEDDKTCRDQIKWFFINKYSILEAEDYSSCFKQLSSNKDIEIVILDLYLPPDTTSSSEGFKILYSLKENYPDISIIVITGSEDKKDAIKAINEEITDFFEKPLDLDILDVVIQRICYKRSLKKEKLETIEEKILPFKFCDIIYCSEKMKEIIERIKTIASTELPVLIEGESGTGKELIAKAIHYQSKRKDFSFVPINCSAIPTSLIESELFGHLKGSFTGAICDKIGKLEIADKGTLFLDEITEMEDIMQAKILRVLADGCITPVGSIKSKKVSFRLISATNKNIEKLISENKFREDLFYRINTVRIKVPPLRERKEEIPYLVDYFIRKYNEQNKGKIKGISKKALSKLLNLEFKGNIRELENIIYLCCAISKGNIIEDISEEVNSFNNINYPEKNITLKERIDLYTKEVLLDVLEKSNWIYFNAAKRLGLSKDQMHYLVKKYKLSKKGFN